MKLTIRLAITMSVTWLLLSGLFKGSVAHPRSAVRGTSSSSGCRTACVCCNIVASQWYFRFLHIAGYWTWLGGQIFQSNVDVVRRVLQKDMPIKPTLRRVTATPDTEIGRVILCQFDHTDTGHHGNQFHPGR